MLSYVQMSSEVKFRHLLEEIQEFRESNLSIRKAYNLALQSWHLTDWVFNEHILDLKIKKAYSEQLTAFRVKIIERCSSLNVMHDIAQEHKHSKVDKPKATIRVLRKDEGAFSQAFNKSFDITRIEIVLKDGSILDFVETINSVISFWQEYFEIDLKSTAKA